MHRRPDIFEDPKRFDPDRFSPEREAKIPKYGYIPFGAGPRECVGWRFAIMEAQLLLATLSRHVKFKRVAGSSDELEVEALITLRPKVKLVVDG